MLKHTISIICTFCFFSATLHAENITFLNDNLKLALKKANTEGKLIFVDFYADYCMPCKIMDEHTFTQSEVASKMASGYVPLKVNITSFDGYDLKNQYQVTVLPTLLILDAKGRMIARYEESMGGAALIKILDKYNVPEFKTHKNPNAVAYNKQTLFSNSAPFVSLGSMKPSSENAIYKANDAPTAEASNSRKPKPVKPYEQPEVNSEDFVERKQTAKYESPAVAEGDKPIKNRPHIAKPQHPAVTAGAPQKNNSNTVPIKQHSYVNTAPPKLEQTTAAASTPTKLTKISNVTDGYTLKIGAYSTEANAQKAANDAKQKLGAGKSRIIVQNKMVGTSLMHRVLVGKFASSEEATAFKNKFSMEGSVVSFQQLK